MQKEPCLWRRQQWQIIYEALRAPRKAQDIARTVGVSPTTVHRVSAIYKQGGVAALETLGKGGRRHRYLTLEQERAFLQPFVARATRGEVATAAEIHRAFEERVGHTVDESRISRLLNRQGWRKRGNGLKASAGSAPGSTAMQERTIPLRKRKKQPSPHRWKASGRLHVIPVI